MSNNQFGISFNYAETLLLNPFSCLKKITIHDHLTILPRYLTNENKINVIAAIKDIYSNTLYFFSKKFLGVPVAYGNIKSANNYGTILEDNPEFHLDIDIDFIVFQPKSGQECKGIVNKISPGHIGVLIHGCFNAALLTNKSQEITIGDEVKFVVTGVQAYKRIFNIRGQLSLVDFIIRSHKDRRKNKVNLTKSSNLRLFIRNTAKEAMQYFNYLSLKKPIDKIKANSDNYRKSNMLDSDVINKDANISSSNDSVLDFHKAKKNSVNDINNLNAGTLKSINLKNNLSNESSSLTKIKKSKNSSREFKNNEVGNLQNATLIMDDNGLVKTEHINKKPKRHKNSSDVVIFTSESSGSEITKNKLKKNLMDNSTYNVLAMDSFNLQESNSNDPNIYPITSTHAKSRKNHSIENEDAISVRQRVPSTSSSRDDSSVVVTQHIQPRKRKKNSKANGDVIIKREKFTSPHLGTDKSNSDHELKTVNILSPHVNAFNSEKDNNLVINQSSDAMANNLKISKSLSLASLPVNQNVKDDLMLSNYNSLINNISIMETRDFLRPYEVMPQSSTKKKKVPTATLR